MKKHQNINTDIYQEICDCGSTKFFLYCLHMNGSGYHDIRAVCTECGRVRDIDDLAYNKKLDPIK